MYLQKGEDILKLTKTGYQLTDFYPSNDTDVVHFRWLHHALRLADNLTISTSTDYYTQSNHYQTHHSDYASTTYDQTITTRNQAGHETKHTIKPYIDDQLAEHFRQVINPELEDLSQRCRALQQQNERQQNEINELTQRVNTLENN